MKLEELKLSLKDLMSENIEQVLLKLKEIVISNSKLYDHVIMATERFYALKNDKIKSIISFEESVLRQNQLTSQTLSLINDLSVNNLDKKIWGYGRFIDELNSNIREYEIYKSEYNDLKKWFNENAEKLDFETIIEYQNEDIEEMTKLKRYNSKIQLYGKLIQITYFDNRETIITDYKEPELNHTVKTITYHQVNFDVGDNVSLIIKTSKLTNFNSSFDDLELNTNSDKKIYYSEGYILDKIYHTHSPNPSFDVLEEGELNEGYQSKFVLEVPKGFTYELRSKIYEIIKLIKE